jgi:hypothetical protein
MRIISVMAVLFATGRASNELCQPAAVREGATTASEE